MCDRNIVFHQLTLFHGWFFCDQYYICGRSSGYISLGGFCEGKDCADVEENHVLFGEPLHCEQLVQGQGEVALEHQYRWGIGLEGGAN